MKTLAPTGSVIALLLSAPLVYPQQTADEHAAHHPPGATNSANSPVSGPLTQAMGTDAMSRMLESMKNMQDLMARIHLNKSPAERQELLQKHSKAMQEQMAMMRGMSGVQGAPTKSQGMMNSDMMEHHAMQSRMDMMQMMMDQMLRHQEEQKDSKAP